MRRFLKTMKWICISIFSFFLLLLGGLYIYTFNSYKPLDEMKVSIETLDTSKIEVSESFDTYFLLPKSPKGNVIIIPGGKVYTESYLFLAYSLALEGYQVYLTKAVFHLSILTPSRAKKFLSNDLPNIIIGHSLGGTVAGMVAKGSTKVDHLILLGSYTTSTIDNSHVLLITAEHDLIMNMDRFNQSLSHYKTYEHHIILGGNHASFGWYGKQKGDGVATITPYEQHIKTLEIIFHYIESHT